MCFGLFGGRLLGKEHSVDEERLVGALGVYAEVADIVGVIDEQAVGKDVMHQSCMHLRTPVLGRESADL